MFDSGNLLDIFRFLLQNIRLSPRTIYKGFSSGFHKANHAPTWNLDELTLSLENADSLRRERERSRCKILHRFIRIKNELATPRTKEREAAGSWKGKDESVGGSHTTGEERVDFLMIRFCIYAAFSPWRNESLLRMPLWCLYTRRYMSRISLHEYTDFPHAPAVGRVIAPIAGGAGCGQSQPAKLATKLILRVRGRPLTI